MDQQVCRPIHRTAASGGLAAAGGGSEGRAAAAGGGAPFLHTSRSPRTPRLTAVRSLSGSSMSRRAWAQRRACRGGGAERSEPWGRAGGRPAPPAPSPPPHPGLDGLPRVGHAAALPELGGGGLLGGDSASLGGV